jgi:hypothetical protein
MMVPTTSLLCRDGRHHDITEAWGFWCRAGRAQPAVWASAATVRALW